MDIWLLLGTDTVKCLVSARHNTPHREVRFDRLHLKHVAGTRRGSSLHRKSINGIASPWVPFVDASLLYYCCAIYHRLLYERIMDPMYEYCTSTNSRGEKLLYCCCRPRIPTPCTAGYKNKQQSELWPDPLRWLHVLAQQRWYCIELLCSTKTYQVCCVHLPPREA